jgi:hypothetical protein
MVLSAKHRGTDRPHGAKFFHHLDTKGTKYHQEKTSFNLQFLVHLGVLGALVVRDVDVIHPHRG